MVDKTASAPAAGGAPARIKKSYTPAVIKAWCKVCGICSFFCPKKVLRCDDTGLHIDHPEHCIGCRFCELHCPDLAISITEQDPKKRGYTG
jgi:2-oxoglutarate ferredoxin oxidoreductase subunit delta